MEILEYLRYPLAFVLAIGILVTVHEFGHFWVARRLGVKVLRFSVGFGPSLLSRRGKVDDTEYVLAAIPLGGYVKMLDENEGDVAPGERGRAFNNQPLWVRYAVVAAGPAFNLFFAVFAFAAMYMAGTYGLRPIVDNVVAESPAAAANVSPNSLIRSINGRETPTYVRAAEAILGASVEDKLLDISLEESDGRIREVRLDMRGLTLDDLAQTEPLERLGIVLYRPPLPALIGAVSAGAPAAEAGFQAGDKVLSTEGTAIDTWVGWRDLIRSNAGKALTVVVERDGQELALEVTPATIEENGETFGRIGAAPAQDIDSLSASYVFDRYGPLEALSAGVQKTIDSSLLMFRVLWKMVTLEISFKNISGPISIAEFAGLSTKAGFAQFLQLLGMLSVSLGILNLLPIPMLDGGHLLYYTVELVRGQPLSEAIQGAGIRIGIVLLVGLMSLAFYNDISRLFGVG